MVQVYKNNAKPSFSSQLMSGINAAQPAIESYINKQRESDAYKQMGLDPAIANLPEQFKEHFIRTGAANKSQNVNYGNEEAAQPPRENINDFLDQNKYQRQELPEFGNQKRQEQPNRQPQQNQMNEGNLLSPSMEGGRERVLKPNEVMAEGKRIAAEQTANNNPTSVLEGVQIAESLNNARINYNQNLDVETGKKISQQEAYGAKGVEKLKNVFPEANDEEQALFKRKGEEYAAKNKSEAEIDKLLSADARKFKNTITSIKNSVGPRRLWSKLESNNRDAEKTRNDINIKLQPLLKEGLYDTARALLNENGFYKEETESIITQLGEGALKNVAKLNGLHPQAGIGKNYVPIPGGNNYLSPEIKEMVKDNMRDVFKSDPSTNLILLRKAYEDRNINWEDFKDNLNDLIMDGEIELNAEQFQMLEDLEKPPLVGLQKLLHGLNLIGR